MTRLVDCPGKLFQACTNFREYPTGGFFLGIGIYAIAAVVWHR